MKEFEFESADQLTGEFTDLRNAAQEGTECK